MIVCVEILRVFQKREHLVPRVGRAMTLLKCIVCAGDRFISVMPRMSERGQVTVFDRGGISRTCPLRRASEVVARVDLMVAFQLRAAL